MFLKNLKLILLYLIFYIFASVVVIFNIKSYHVATVTIEDKISNRLNTLDKLYFNNQSKNIIPNINYCKNNFIKKIQELPNIKFILLNQDNKIIKFLVKDAPQINTLNKKLTNLNNIDICISDYFTETNLNLKMMYEPILSGLNQINKMNNMKTIKLLKNENWKRDIIQNNVAVTYSTTLNTSQIKLYNNLSEKIMNIYENFDNSEKYRRVILNSKNFEITTISQKSYNYRIVVLLSIFIITLFIAILHYLFVSKKIKF